jgi:hypothetical protein
MNSNFNFKDLITSSISEQRRALQYGTILGISSQLKLNQHLMMTH